MKIGNIRLLCGGRNNGKTLQQYLDIQKWAIENGYEKVKFEFVTPDIIEIQKLIDYLKEKKKEYTELYNKSCDIIDFDRYESLNILCEEILSKIEKE